MEQGPIPGWDEMARTLKGREDAKITNDLIQQAGRADPDPPNRRGLSRGTAPETPGERGHGAKGG